MNPETVPLALRLLPQWVAWRYETRGEKRTKVPYHPSGRLARSNDPTTWSSFEAVYTAPHRFDGLGIMCGGPAQLAGVDLDHHIDPAGRLSDLAQRIVAQMNTYTEVTPSGEGLRCLFWGTLPEGKRRNQELGIEMYDHERFFTVTGKHLEGTPRLVHPRTSEVAALHQALMQRERERPAPVAAATSNRPAPRDVTELVQRASRARNGARFDALYRGDTTGYASQSNADLALCNILAYWADGDATLIDQAFRSSGLMRDKWDRNSGRATYGELTIERCTRS